jgi:hypothetical protein
MPDDFTWPEPSELKPAEAMRLLDEKQAEATAANRAAEAAKDAKKKANKIALDVLDMYELGSADTIVDSGKRVLFYTEQFRTFTVKDQEAFDACENYYETQRKLREQVFVDYCKGLEDDGQPLPPGVEKFEETRLKRMTK